MRVCLRTAALAGGLAVWALLTGAQAQSPGKGSASEPLSFYFEAVKMPADYWVGKYEVTQAQYEEITGENPSTFPSPTHPVETVCWEEAEAFCQKLTAREHAAHRLPAEYVYDLPTDTQWDEFAAGTRIADGVTSLAHPRFAPEPVGTLPANTLGLCDVVGNVWEWCLDWYSDAIRRKDANPDVPFGALAQAPGTTAEPEETYKVLRGGSWDTTPTSGFALGARLRYAPGMSNYRTGFRCIVVKRAAVPSPSPSPAPIQP